MLIGSPTIEVTIYDHEEDFDEMVEWLEKPGVQRENLFEEGTKNFLGFRYNMYVTTFNEFSIAFDICTSGGKPVLYFEVKR